MGRGYRLPEYKSVTDEDFNWHAAKLAEETGEVCQTICKRKNLQETVAECIDVIQCCENIMRKAGITDSCLQSLFEQHVAKDEERGYLKEEGVLV